MVEQTKGYVIFEKLGSGAFGNVHRAVRESDGYEVAIKVIQ